VESLIQKTPNKKIFFLGCGKMGTSLLKALLKNGFESEDFLVMKPSDNNQIDKVNYVSSYEEIAKDYCADIVFFTFKPQKAKEILSNFAKQNIYNSNTIFISILAGKRVTSFEDILGPDIKLVRLMPNLPIVIGEGIFAYFCNSKIKETEIIDFLNLLGKNIKLEKEELIDVVTAISGSGPAYLFLFIQMMVEASKKLGLSPDISEKIIKQTIYGSAKMALTEDRDLDQLISDVASKGGTTEAALEILSEDNIMQNIITRATDAALSRARLLAK
jgi:pyrroline-5-carboxylate reductase